MSQCEVEFRSRGFIDNLDKEPNVIGVGNGVLRLYPRTEMIQRYHEMPISRSTRVHFVPEKIDLRDPAWSTDHPNPFIRKLLVEIRRLFSDEEDAFIFTMCYLASSLDSRKKSPLFYIWLGEGSNGKSFLLELHIKTLCEVVRAGYAAKMNAAYFTKETRASGPDSEKMMLKYARFAYCSESKIGDVLQMDKIKEFTSETLSANEKHQTQDMFEANCQFVFGSNHDPRITGRDYGTWRRILVYYFKMKFVDKPDPANRFEWPCDYKLVQDVPYQMDYKRAYFSILVYFYEMYRDVYKYNLNNISKPSIDAETQKYRNEQDTIERYISEQIVFIGKVFPDTHERVPNIDISEVAKKYIEWHRRCIDDATIQPKDVIHALYSTRLRKFISKSINKQECLTQHRILSGDDYISELIPEPAPTELISVKPISAELNQPEPKPTELTEIIETTISNMTEDDLDDDLEDALNSFLIN